MATIWRLSDPAALARLRSSRARARAEAVWVTWAPPVDPEAPPRVAFAIGRRVGGAVVRNRIRRRLRALLAASDLAAGDYLVGATSVAATMPWDQLSSQVDDALRALWAAPGRVPS